MSTKKRRNTNSQHRDSTVGVGMSAKQRRRKRPINNSVLVDVEPITDNQKVLFDHYAKGKNIFGYGWCLQERLVSCQETMKISHHSTRFLIRIW